jgi:uncharacterized lipoprotein YbaY
MLLGDTPKRVGLCVLDFCEDKSMIVRMKPLVLTAALSAGLGWGALGWPQRSHAGGDTAPAQAEEPVWYNCLTREVWSPAKQVWCDQLATLHNLDYTLPGYGVIPLEQGEFEDTGRRLHVVLPSQPGWVVFDDLDGDEQTDALVLLAVNSGGSGQFTYLTPVLHVETDPEPLRPVFLGDRVQIHTLTVTDQEVAVNLTTHAADDPLCCPTLETTWRYRLQPTLVPLNEAMASSLLRPAPLSQNSADTDVERPMTEPDAAIAQVTGTVRYLPRIALPPSAIVEVSLQNVSRADAPALTLSTQTIELNGQQVPVDFALPYDATQIDPRHTYMVRASIRVGDELWFTSTRAYPVITQTYPTVVDVVVDLVRGR